MHIIRDDLPSDGLLMLACVCSILIAFQGNSGIIRIWREALTKTAISLPSWLASGQSVDSETWNHNTPVTDDNASSVYNSSSYQVSMVVGALDDFTQILTRRSEAMEEQIPALQQKVKWWRLWCRICLVANVHLHICTGSSWRQSAIQTIKWDYTGMVIRQATSGMHHLHHSYHNQPAG